MNLLNASVLDFLANETCIKSLCSMFAVIYFRTYRLKTFAVNS